MIVRTGAAYKNTPRRYAGLRLAQGASNGKARSVSATGFIAHYDINTENLRKLLTPKIFQETQLYDTIPRSTVSKVFSWFWSFKTSICTM